MLEIIVLLILGIILIAIGISHTKGHLSSLHSYHYKRVKKDDIIPFGKKVGLGTIIIGSSMVINAMLYIIIYFTNIQIFELIGNIILIISFVIGIAIIFYAMFKYNKGIF